MGAGSYSSIPKTAHSSRNHSIRILFRVRSLRFRARNWSTKSASEQLGSGSGSRPGRATSCSKMAFSLATLSVSGCSSSSSSGTQRSRAKERRHRTMTAPTKGVPPIRNKRTAPESICTRPRPRPSASSSGRALDSSAATGLPLHVLGHSHATRSADLTSRELQGAAEAAALMVKSKTRTFRMVSAGGLPQDTAGCPCVRFRVLACCRVGKRGAFARTVVLREAPSQKLRAPVLQAS